MNTHRLSLKGVRLALVALALAAATRGALSQSYAVRWSVIAGGGATTPSTGGSYAVSGTIAQPEVDDPLDNGPYAVTGGFWAGVTTPVPAPGAPMLSSELLPEGNVRISWPAGATGFVLDQAGALVSPAGATRWSHVPFPYQTNATHVLVTVPARAGNTFYRLRKP